MKREQFFLKDPTTGFYYRQKPGGGVICDAQRDKADLFDVITGQFAPPECIKETPTREEQFRCWGRSGGSVSSRKKSIANRRKRRAQIIQQRKARAEARKQAAEARRLARNDGQI